VQGKAHSVSKDRVEAAVKSGRVSQKRLVALLLMNKIRRDKVEVWGAARPRRMLEGQQTASLLMANDSQTNVREPLAARALLMAAGGAQA
jgi:hypothetical protein